MSKLPVITKNTSVNDYMRQMEKYRLDQIKEKYNFILELLNDILKLKDERKYTTLTLIKNVPQKLFTDIFDNNEIFDKKKEQIKNIFGIEMNKEELNDAEINKTLRTMLSSIGYKIHPSKYNDKLYWSIRLK